MHDLPFEQLCSRCGLGKMTANPIPLTGGFLHKMFRIETEKGIFAAKALDRGIMSRPAAPGNFRFSEEVARAALQAGLPVLSAIPADGDILISTGEQYWMLFDWQEGSALRPDEVTVMHARRIGSILGRLHTLLPAADESPDVPSYDWERFTGQKMPWSKKFEQMLPQILQWTAEGCEALLPLSRDRVLSHRDMDPKNVLWHKGEPCIIDWEAAGPVHPIQEMCETALCWSCNGQNEENLAAFIEGYLQFVKPDPLLAGHAAAAVILGRLDWLYYNLGRSLGAEGADEASRAVGVGQVIDTLSALEVLCGTLPLMRKYCLSEKE